MTKLVLCGAGKKGKACYDFISQLHGEGIVECFLDNYSEEKVYKGVPIYRFDSIPSESLLVYFISVNSEDAKASIKKQLTGKKIVSFDEIASLLGIDPVVFNRDFVAFYHVDYMDSYFENAEKTEDINRFWQGDTFLPMFNKLDTSKIVEIACGHGRHVPFYANDADEVVLVDILQKNIDFCKERFKTEFHNIKYYKNDGFDLKELPSDHYTSIFSYDAMVHFEMMDIFSYLKEFYRILQPGGAALIHHSNTDDDYKDSFVSSPGGRGFMNAKLFAYLASRCGFEVEEQKVIDFCKKDGDCITLLRKPNLA